MLVYKEDPMPIVAMSGALYDKIITLLRKVQEEHTETVEGVDAPWKRCTVCGSEIRAHIMTDCRCWMASVDYLLEELLSQEV